MRDNVEKDASEDWCPKCDAVREYDGDRMISMAGTPMPPPPRPDPLPNPVDPGFVEPLRPQGRSRTGSRMTRSRKSARNAGTRFERVIADWLAEHVDDRIDRRVKTGSKDRGDIGGWRFAGRRIVAELKDVARFDLGGWVREAETERLNDDAHVGLVIVKRRGSGDPGDQYVVMTLRDLIVLTTGERP